LSLLAQQYTFIPVILVIIIILLVIMEFVLPLLRPNNDQTTSKAN
jgi:NADH:ubiquinone oxidoreductase subunit 3 (subunit A)